MGVPKKPLLRSVQHFAKWKDGENSVILTHGFLETYKNEIQTLCENHKVKSLYAFGSVNSTTFAQESDVDLIVEFKIDDPIEYTDYYFELKFELEKIFNRPIDLLESKGVKNPFLKQSIDKNKVLVYG